ncbi:YopX family protein [Shouchella patagoniensis]|uniref:YopX family protein n=1 Tax=Shouchella patagoniensis TaxID=228576 RepID=UPI0009949995|nr:YopX family protein [Shouchella patagoniensis]
MRDILFRGKATMSEKEMEELNLTHSNGWVYGNLIKDGDLTFIVGPVADWDSEYLAHEWWLKVDPETVGQATGVYDENGDEIWEGDEATRYDGEKFVTGNVVYREGAFWIDNGKDAIPLFDEITLSETRSY